MKFSGRTQMLSDRYSVFEALDVIKKLGFDGAELCFEDMNFRIRPDLWDPRIIPLIREHCEKIGLAISAVGNHLPYFFDDTMFASVKKCIKTTRQYGADTFIFAAMNSAADKEAHADLRDIALSRIGELCKLAESEGVRLALEPEPPSIITSTADFLGFYNDIGSPALGVNMDVGHSFLTDDDILESVELLKGKIFHGHIEDMKKEKHMHLMPGEGEMPLRALMKKLRDVGFDGYMSFDMYNARYEDVAGKALAALRKIQGEALG